MGFEKRVLAVVKSETDTGAYFFNGTLFLETEDSEIAVRVFNSLSEQVTAAIAFGRVGQSETSYDFLT
ncbi:MAG: hypothetical protein FJ211_09880 [Ignavibacteria bacterium]|nr:hypothetical protein [Ignavibacteria bacterium]